jgi:hypothetical protein
VNRSLEVLLLNDCNLGKIGASIVGRSLRRNIKLSKLSLSSNQLEDAGLLSLLDGVLENISQNHTCPLLDLDFSKNGIELTDPKLKGKLCKILSEASSKIQNLSLRDNLIRDDAADAISMALRSNLSIMKLQIDMNPIKIATLKEMEISVKRNIVRHKELRDPALKKEFYTLKEER